MASSTSLPLDVVSIVVNSAVFDVPQLCRLCMICQGWREIILESMDLWRHVSFVPCERSVTGEVLQRLLQPPRTRGLRSLDVSFCSRLETHELRQMIDRCGRHLDTLVLSHCQAVDDSVLSLVAEVCLELKFLALNHLQRISDAGVQMVVRKISGLKMLEASGSSLSEEAADLIESDNFKVLMLDRRP